MAAVGAKKTKVAKHRQQSTKIGSGRNIVSGGDGNSDDIGDDNDGNLDSNNDDNNDGGGGGVAGEQQQLLTAWYGAGIRRPKAAEMGIKWKWEQCGYYRLIFLISKIVTLQVAVEC